MDNKKINVGILFGGKSAEHEVSLRSAKNVIDAIDKEKYNPVLIGINKEGKWLLNDSSCFLLNSDDPEKIKLNPASDDVVMAPQCSGEIANLSRSDFNKSIDVIFPILHGPFGEDGTVQGLLKLANIPFVGAGVLGSAVGMDKDVMNRLLRDAGLPIAKFIVLNYTDKPDYAKTVEELGLPMFVKPANLGSSVGVSKVHNQEEFDKAVIDAFQYDTKLIIEENINGREIECSVLGNSNPIASLPGEVILKDDFYSYETKYINEDGASIEIPAKLSEDIIKQIQDLAVETFKVLSCEGLARVDFFLQPDNKVVVNEINTIPGFTSISMYPKLWEASGIGYTELIDKLIQLAFERFGREQKLKTSYTDE
ncbi:MAG: D-alanine--D-alanine ligase [Parcubacteria group bacterium]|nr:D-alanine--D-alanine ligase [Parcubacteria group bacterium]